MTADYYVRPMRDDDVEQVDRLTEDTFFDLDVRTHRPGFPEPERPTPEQAERWRRRIRHVLAHDPGGCWVAEDRTGLIGAAVSLKRELMWILASYVVRPGLQGRGVGRQLLDAALGYGDGCLRGMLSASSDTRAVRRYLRAGFAPHPNMLLRGPVPRDVLPVVDHVREGGLGDVDLMNSVDRQVRGAAHGVDHEELVASNPLVVVDRSTGSGYAYLRQDGGPQLLAATNRRTATALLWETLAACPPDKTALVTQITSANAWALDVGMAARMELHTAGYTMLRDMKPPAPYLPHGHYL